MADNADTLHDNTIGWAILGLVFAVICWLIWFYFEYQIKDGIRMVRYAEMKAVTYFVDEDYTILWNGRDIPYEDTVAKISKIPANCDTVENRRDKEGLGVCLNDATMSLISFMAMEPLRFVFAGILSVIALWAYMYGPKTVFRRTLTINGLLGHQARFFPIIAPFVKFDPGEQPPRPPGSPVPANLPLFAEALGPEEWVAYNEIPVPDGRLDAEAAAAAFAKQLGPPWRGAQRLPAYKQILLAAFCLKAVRKRSEADAMLGQLSSCWSVDGGLKLDGKLVRQAKAVLAKRDISGGILSACNQHAYQTTALIRALATAREEGGVLSPSQFVWLRGYDRELWYPLNNLGRQSFHMEALGAMAHFKVEKMTMRPIPRPKVEDAVGSITEYMSSNRARPIPQLDYSKSGGRRHHGGIKRVGGTAPAKKTGRK